ncbi:MAG: SIMPL domain-containing protein [Ilumatobacteraceae bacterium]
MTVTGDGKVTVRPDTASLSLGVQATDRTATDALSQANTSAAALIAALKAAGVYVDDVEAAIGAARANAIDNARKRAAEYAAAAGVAVGDVIMISEVTFGYPAPLFARSAFKSVSDSPAPAPIETGTQDLTASVTVVYEIA